MTSRRSMVRYRPVEPDTGDAVQVLSTLDGHSFDHAVTSLGRIVADASLGHDDIIGRRIPSRRT